MRRNCLILLMLTLSVFCFAQSENTPLKFTGFFENFDFSQNFTIFDPVPVAFENTDENELQVQQNQSIFANAPQWVKDIRRGEIVFFGTFPFTVFFSRFFIDLFRMGRNNWDQRYAPWPLQSAGAVAMNSTEIRWVFAIASAVSLSISIADHLIVRNKRRAADLDR